MPELLTCPQGHQWHFDFDEESQSFSESVACPTCGAVMPLYQAVNPPDSAKAPTPAIQPPPPEPTDAPEGKEDKAEVPTIPGRKLAGAPAPPSRVSIPGYEILGELGRGGMGVVYKARQRGLNRIVALKMILAASHASAKELTRFRHEGEVVAQLHHPNIVQIFEVGETEGRPFFSLEFVPGGSMSAKLDGTPWPVRQAAQLLAKLARAIHAAHQLGIVHRDLKPANVLIDNDGTPKITDFGLAKKIDDSAGPTQSGAILGTPSYMAPEQAAGKTHQVGPVADVYALGSMLYELLTGRPPFRAETPVETLMQVVGEEPLPPHRLQPKVPRDIETICLKCLQKKPEQRYKSAEELAEDLDRFLAGSPIKARPQGIVERVLKAARRHPAVPAVSAVALLLGGGVIWALSQQEADIKLTAMLIGVTVVLFGFSAWQGIRAQLQRRRAEEQRQQAQAARTEAEGQRGKAEAARREAEDQAHKAANALAAAEGTLYFLQIALAERELLTAHVSRAEELLEACPASLRHWEWNYLKRLCHGELVTLKGHNRPVLALAFSPDGRHLVSGGWDQTINVWGGLTGEKIRVQTGHTAQVTSLTYSRDGRWLASAGGDQNIILWDAENGQQLLTLQGHQWSVLGLDFSPNGRRLASAGGDQVVRIWDCVTGKALQVLRGHTREVTSVAYSHDGRFIAAAGGDQIVRVWDAVNGQEVHCLRGHTGPVLGVAFSPVQPVLASASEDRTVRLWDCTDGREILICRGHAGSVLTVAFSHDGRLLASGSWDRTAKLWDPTTGQEAATLRGHAGIVTHVAFRPEGHRLATCSEDKTVKIWEISGGSEARSLTGHSNGVLAVAFSPDSRRLVSGSGRLLGNAPGEVKLWDLEENRELRSVGAAAGGARVAYSPDGLCFASVHESGLVSLYKADTGKKAWKINGHTRAVIGVAFHPDGERLVTASEDGNAKVWDAANGREILAIRANMGPLVALAYSPDGRHIALASRDRVKNRSEIKIWDSTNGASVLDLGRHSVAVAELAFSLDGQFLAVANRDATVKMYELSTGKAFRTLRGHTGEVEGLAFSCDGKRLASASHDRTVKLWDVATGQEILTLKGHTAEVAAVAFSRDGRLVASAGMDQTVRIWDATPQGSVTQIAPAPAPSPAPAEPAPPPADEEMTRLDVGRRGAEAGKA
jgi:WD40 repeat protein/tRNA A-37 threonylcarbamoyl transferase component Bud32